MNSAISSNWSVINYQPAFIRLTIRGANYLRLDESDTHEIKETSWHVYKSLEVINLRNCEFRRTNVVHSRFLSVFSTEVIGIGRANRKIDWFNCWTGKSIDSFLSEEFNRKNWSTENRAGKLIDSSSARKLNRKVDWFILESSRKVDRLSY